MDAPSGGSTRLAQARTSGGHGPGPEQAERNRLSQLPAEVVSPPRTLQGALVQGASISAPLTSTLCCEVSRMFSSIPGPYPLGANSIPSCDDPNCLQTLRNAPGGPTRPLREPLV